MLLNAYRRVFLSGLFSALCLIAPKWAQAQLTFIVQPILSPEESTQVFQPLASYLQQAAGEPVKIVAAHNFLTYWQTMIQGEYDLILDAAHFTSYRIEKMGYTPLAKIPGTVSYSLVSKADFLVLDPSELIGKSIATTAPPSMGMMRLSEVFSNPIRLPRFTETASADEALADVVKGITDAAIIPTPLLNNHPELNLIITTDPAPHITLSAGPEVTAEQQQIITEALLDAKNTAQGKAMLSAINFDEFVTADPAIYANHHLLLADEWGY